MLKVESNIAVRNVLISLLNDAIIIKNRQTTGISQLKTNFSNNYEILHQSPEMMEIISVRKYHSLKNLITMALKVESAVSELNMVQELSLSA